MSHSGDLEGVVCFIFCLQDPAVPSASASPSHVSGDVHNKASTNKPPYRKPCAFVWIDSITKTSSDHQLHHIRARTRHNTFDVLIIVFIQIQVYWKLLNFIQHVYFRSSCSRNSHVPPSFLSSLSPASLHISDSHVGLYKSLSGQCNAVLHVWIEADSKTLFGTSRWRKKGRHRLPVSLHNRIQTIRL